MCQVDGVSMSHSGRIKSFAVVVDSTGTVNDFVASITIHIAYTQIVVSLSGVLVTSGMVAVEYPTVLQFFSVPVEGSQNSTRVVASAHDNTWVYSVKIGYTSQEAVASVTFCVSPVGNVAAGRDIVDGM